MQFRLMSAAFLAVAVPAAMAQTVPVRPSITGISHIAVYTSDAAATDHFYRLVVGAEKQPDPENSQGVRYVLSATQFVEVLPLPAGAGVNRLDHTAWNTTNAEAMRRYLAAKGWKTPDKVERSSDGSRWFEVKIRRATASSSCSRRLVLQSYRSILFRAISFMSDSSSTTGRARMPSIARFSASDPIGSAV